MKQHMLTHKMRDMPQHMFEHSMRSTSLDRDSGHSFTTNQNSQPHDDRQIEDDDDDASDIRYSMGKRATSSLSDDCQRSKDTDNGDAESDSSKQHNSHVSLGSDDDDDTDNVAHATKRKRLGE